MTGKGNGELARILGVTFVWCQGRSIIRPRLHCQRPDRIGDMLRWAMKQECKSALWIFGRMQLQIKGAAKEKRHGLLREQPAFRRSVVLEEEQRSWTGTWPVTIQAMPSKYAYFYKSLIHSWGFSQILSFTHFCLSPPHPQIRFSWKSTPWEAEDFFPHFCLTLFLSRTFPSSILILSKDSSHIVLALGHITCWNRENCLDL